MKIKVDEMEHREAHRFLMGIIVPRPIAFISTVGEDGVYNIAPYSAFTNLSISPPIVCFSVAPKRDGKKKDTLRNIEYSGEFVINMVTEEIAEVMNLASASFPPEVDEFKEAGLTPLPSDLVKAPRLAESPTSMECRRLQILEFGERPRHSSIVIGEVVLVHVRDDFCEEGKIQYDRFKAVGRMGGESYCRTRDTFEMVRPPSGYD